MCDRHGYLDQQTRTEHAKAHRPSPADPLRRRQRNRTPPPPFFSTVPSTFLFTFLFSIAGADLRPERRPRGSHFVGYGAVRAAARELDEARFSASEMLVCPSPRLSTSTMRSSTPVVDVVCLLIDAATCVSLFLLPHLLIMCSLWCGVCVCVVFVCVFVCACRDVRG